MLSTAIIIFREVLEIAIIMGVLLAATRGLKGRWPWILLGSAGGVLGAGMVALSAESISAALSGSGQEIFNAGVLFTAALMIGWTLVWMRAHAREMAAQLREVGHNVSLGRAPFYSLSVITGLALLREGSEIVMFTYGMLLTGQGVAVILSGGLLGGVLGLLVGVLLYYGLLRMATRYMLNVTSWVLMLLVAGLAAQGAGYLSAAGYFSSWSTPLWDTSWLLSERSIVGNMLHVLVGYSSRPTAVQLLFYVGALLTLGAFVMRKEPGRSAVPSGKAMVGG